MWGALGERAVREPPLRGEGGDGERGGGCTPILTFPPEGGREGIEGEVCTPIPRLHEGRL